jgi:hypothetical protein
MPVFGADVSNTQVDWEEPKPRRGYVRNEVFDDVRYFMCHPMSPMDHAFSDAERGVIIGVVSRLRKRGYDSRAIRGAMNAFYLQRNKDSGHPAYVFANNEVLRRLMSVYEPRFLKPVRAFIANGFQRTDEELPWHSDDDPDIRRSVMLYGGDLPFRYADVVADLLVVYGDSTTELNSQLRYINDIVQWNLDKSIELDIKSHLASIKVSLPKELTTARRAPLSIRTPAPTLREAVMFVNERVDHGIHDTDRLEEREVVAKPLRR